MLARGAGVPPRARLAANCMAAMAFTQVSHVLHTASHLVDVGGGGEELVEAELSIHTLVRVVKWLLFLVQLINQTCPCSL